MKQAWLDQLPVQQIISLTPIRGGDVNLAYRLDTESKPLFLLVQRNQPVNFYYSEIAGLNELQKAGINTPKVIHYGEIEDDAYLILDYLEEGHGRQSDLGRLVAKMHSYYQADGLFGFEEDYIGAQMRFDNEWTDSWVELFIYRRLDKLSQAITDQNLWSNEDVSNYESVRRIIINVLQARTSQPSLLHGDLWSGNFLFLKDGTPVLFDPHVVYGDREFDIGITTVFGGFNDDFYEGYNEALPLDDGASDRLEFYRLYFLMIHLNKFGGIYLQSVQHSMNNILQTFAD